MNDLDLAKSISKQVEEGQYEYDTENPTALSEIKVKALQAKLDALLELQKTLSHYAATSVLSALENVVRIGWCLIDIKAEKKGVFYEYAEIHFPFSARQAERMMKAARNFQRDIENVEFIESITTVPLAMEYSGAPLIDQIKQTGARHFQDLLVTGGLAPARVAISPAGRSVPTGIFKLLRSIDSAALRFVRVEREFPIEDWSDADREVVKRKLKPLVELFERLS
jgi:hypothetical protein